MRIARSFSDSLDVVTLIRSGIEESYISARRASDDNLALFRGFPPNGGEPVSQFVFGGRRFHGGALSAMGSVSWPVTWVHGDGCSGDHVAGIQGVVLSGTTSHELCLDDALVGRTYEDDDALYCFLGGVLPTDTSRSRTEQAREVFERIEMALAKVGMGYGEVVRTWLFLEDILDWYGDFNHVRTAFFEERGVFDGVVPASTGIGAANPAGAALVAGVYAIKPKHKAVSATPVRSPLQCPALQYRSSFSRAVEVEFPDRKHLLISGTASISPDGRSAHLGDVGKQIDLTMRVVGALLESRGMGWADATRMVAYFKSMRDAAHFIEYCEAQQLPPLPVAWSHAAVCRDDLLFEVELDAVVSR